MSFSIINYHKMKNSMNNKEEDRMQEINCFTARDYFQDQEVDCLENNIRKHLQIYSL